ncbi:MAG: hypothetical protein K8E66_02225, partial [Phycisphaerales bacterium]|nr:hypothetical protein [Phycisphaerales bacterium]
MPDRHLDHLGGRSIPKPYSAPQLRMDTWNDFQLRCAWLNEFSREKRDLDEPRGLVEQSLAQLREFESYWAFPGADRVSQLSKLLERGTYGDLSHEARELVRQLVGDTYRMRDPSVEENPRGSRNREGGMSRSFEHAGTSSKPYFEVLFVDGIDPHEEEELREKLRECRRESDEFIYEIVTVPTFEDAIIAVQFNWTIQAVFLRYNYSYRTPHQHPVFRRYLDVLRRESLPVSFGLDRSVDLAGMLHKLRPELDLYLVTDSPLERVAGNHGTDFRRVFYRLEQHMEQHLTIMKGIRSRYDTPFFDALRRFSAKPTGVFHALPIARGKSMSSGHWARDLLEFYGLNIFMAETSATSGGLDSLLQPRGPIKRAQD